MGRVSFRGAEVSRPLLLPEYFLHCRLPENQVVLPEYCMIFFLPENCYLKNSKGKGTDFTHIIAVKIAE